MRALLPGLRKVITVLPWVALLALPLVPSAHALVVGNPSPDFKSGDFGVGAALSDRRETLFVDIGLSDPGTLRILAGNLNFGRGVDGTEVGVGYRHKLAKGFDLGKFPVRLGVVGQFRLGSADLSGGAESEFTLIHLGAGGAITPTENLNVYAAALVERVTADVDLPFVGRVEATDTSLGVALGAEFWITPAIVAGLEISGGLDDNDLAIFGAFKF